MDHSHHETEKQQTMWEYMKFVLLIAGISFVSIVGNYSLGGTSFEEFMSFFMAVFFLTFGSFKLIGYQMFVMMYPTYDLIAARYKFYAYIYPFIELTLGVLYLLDTGGAQRDIFTALVMGVGALGVYREIRNKRGRKIQCACLGNIIKLPLSTVTLLEDVVMGVMAVAMLVT